MSNQTFLDFLNGLSPEARQGVGSFYGTTGFDSSYNPYSNIDINRYDNLDKKENPADKLYADLIRAQTQDYQTRYAPIERFMADQITATGTKALEGDLGRTRQAILGASQNVEGQQMRAMGRMGLNYTQGTADNQSTVGSLVGGLNDTRMRDADRREAILSGNLGALSQKARGSIS